jgi:hypothetical protein
MAVSGGTVRQSTKARLGMKARQVREWARASSGATRIPWPASGRRPALVGYQPGCLFAWVVVVGLVGWSRSRNRQPFRKHVTLCLESAPCDAGVDSGASRGTTHCPHRVRVGRGFPSGLSRRKLAAGTACDLADECSEVTGAFRSRQREPARQWRAAGRERAGCPPETRSPRTGTTPPAHVLPIPATSPHRSNALLHTFTQIIEQFATLRLCGAWNRRAAARACVNGPTSGLVLPCSTA